MNVAFALMEGPVKDAKKHRAKPDNGVVAKVLDKLFNHGKGSNKQVLSQYGIFVLK